MRLTIDAAAFQLEAAFMTQFIANLDNAAKADVLNESNEAEEKIKEAMPVDTGRARTGWGHYTPELMVYDDPSNPSVASDAIWQVEDDGRSITQGTNVPYVGELNEGTSRQAPAGFIDAVALLALEDLETAMGNDAERLWMG